MNHKLTDEQQHAVDLARQNHKTRIIALAGTGKTTTMRAIAENLNGERGIYIAFNRAIVADSAAKLRTLHDSAPTCRTFHALALDQVSDSTRERLERPIDRPERIAELFDVKDVRFGPKLLVSGVELARRAQLMVGRFAKTLDPTPRRSHIRLTTALKNLPPEARDSVRAEIFALGQKIWDDIQASSGNLKLEFDYLPKLWDLSETTLDLDYVLFDEAQDADAVMMSIIRRQTSARVVICGDPNQNIYTWRGSVEALTDDYMKTDAESYLTLTFRFGTEIAEQANRFLNSLGSRQLRGDSTKHSKVVRETNPDAVIFGRRNDMMSYAAGRLKTSELSSVGLIGGADSPSHEETRALANAKLEFEDAGITLEQAFSDFEDWHEIERFIALQRDEDERNPLNSSLNVVDSVGAEHLVAVYAAITTDESQAGLALGTTYSAKGGEWNRVRLIGIPSVGECLSRWSGDYLTQKLREGYVAVTRARNELEWRGAFS